MGGPMDGIWRGIHAELDERQQRQWYPAKVIERVGTRLRVRRLGAVSTAEIEGPFPTLRGAAENAQPGDQVIVDWRYGSPVIAGAVSGSDWASLFTCVGSDTEVRETQSTTTWETLLDVQGLAIPAASVFFVTCMTQAIEEGSSSAPEKQIQVLLNDEVAAGFGVGSNVVFGDPDVRSSMYLFVTPLAEGFSPPYRNLWELAAAGAAGLSAEGEINRVRIQGRTQDASGDDRLRAQNLLVYA